jgi:hypothetical protein
MSVFHSQDGEYVRYRSSSNYADNLLVKSDCEDALFAELKFKVANGKELSLGKKLAYYDINSTKRGSLPLNFKIIAADFSANTQSISLEVVTTKDIAKDTHSKLTEALRGGAKSQIIVTISAVNDAQTIDQSSNGVAVKYIDTSHTVFSMDEGQTKALLESLMHACWDNYKETNEQNARAVTQIIFLSGQWDKDTPIKSWTSTSDQKIAVGVIGTD